MHRELSSALCDNLEQWDDEGGREAPEGEDMCVADFSLCCVAEMNKYYKAIATVVSRFTRLGSQLFATLWTVACQAPLSKEFSSQEHWSRLPCLPPGALPYPGIISVSPAL